ncbi:UNVERIFIED_CONTAM: hypothetical protein GTU68_036992 [Idotea baltica]|nr:hypothetical protein [Idotea baltica]
MEFKEIQDLLKLVNKTSLTEVEIEQKDFKIKIRRKTPESNVIYTTQQAPSIQAAPLAAPVMTSNPEPVVAATAETANANDNGAASDDLYEFKSPMIGTFYRSSTPEADAFVKVGDHVEKGQVLCIVEAMKLFNEIESEVAGKIVKILIEDAQPIEYDQALFLIDTSA